MYSASQFFSDKSYTGSLCFRDFRYLQLHGKHCGSQHKCANALVSLLFLGLFCSASSSEIKSLRESCPNLMCLAVPLNKSSFLQRLLGVLLNSDLETWRLDSQLV